jgi:hypothetical protein
MKPEAALAAEFQAAVAENSPDSKVVEVEPST